ncbi:HPr family phosphocarrier protein [Paenibacillus turpanensis]|uniref:HPr family phosphocarrier protein n=1 Tax=Paenibacillus turpanensis TaxID=2689078 RepID=UPI00140D2642|nr:HPr family phosphocarrier protein [Paenibacillus turpanensis]
MPGINPNSIVEINRTASEFQSSIVLREERRVIDVKSILGLSITLLHDHTYHLEIHGPDEAEAKEAMLKVFRKHGLNVELV